MKRHIFYANLLWLIALPSMWAENVTLHGTLGMLEADLETKTGEVVGTVEVWNNHEEINLNVIPGDYLLSKVYVYIDTQPVAAPVDLEGIDVVEEPDFGEWPVAESFKKDASTDPYPVRFGFEEDLGFEWGHWGPKWLENKLVTLAVRVELKTTEAVPRTFIAWAVNPNVPFDTQRTEWGENAYAFRYEIQHPMHGQFALFNGPVNGLGASTRTQSGVTGIEGGYWYFPGEFVIFTIGDVEIGFGQAAQRMTPLDIFPSSESTDPPVVNMARLLKTLDSDGEPQGAIDLTGSVATLQEAMDAIGMTGIDFSNTEEIDALIAKILELDNSLVELTFDDAVALLEDFTINRVMRRNISKSPEYATDKPKLDIMPMWVPAKTAAGLSTIVEYKDEDGNVIEGHAKVKPLFVTYTEEQEPNYSAGIYRRATDIITAVSMDDGATWKRFNVSHMANKSSFQIEGTGERFPGNCRRPQQKIEGNNILVTWTSAYARGGKPGFAEKDSEGNQIIDDLWGVRGKQGSVDYDEDKDVGDQGIGVIPYYALWACRGKVDTGGNITWFKPERLTSGRRDAFYQVMSSAKGAGFAVTWQEDPGGLRPGSCLGGGDGWSGATVHKKTDIWYSYISLADFGKIDYDFDPSDMGSDEHGEDGHGSQPEISNRPKWLVPMAHPVRISDNNTVNTDNLKVELDPDTGLPLIGDDGSFIVLEGALEEDYVAHEHETEGGCGDGDDGGDGDGHSGQTGTGGGWGMARYAYMIPELDIASTSPDSTFWSGTLDGEYIPSETDQIRWYRFINKPGMEKTVAVTADGRVLDGDTGACRPNLKLVPTGTKGKAWAILGYEETKGLGTPPEGDHETEDEGVDRPEPDDSGKNVIYHTFPFDQPDMVSGGDIVNLPALSDDGELIPIYYKDALGEDTDVIKTYKTENARRVRFLVQPKSSAKKAGANTVMVVLYKQGREGKGKPSDIFAVRTLLSNEELASPDTSVNPYRFENFERFGELDPGEDVLHQYKFKRKHMNMSSAEVLAIDPTDIAEDDEGHAWGKVSDWGQFGQGNSGGYAPSITHESFANPYSDAKGHRGFIRGKKVVIGYSWTPNWGRRGGDHMDFFVRRSFDGANSWTTDPNGSGTEHTVIVRDSDGNYVEQKRNYGRGEFEPARNVSILKGNSKTITDPRLVPPMGTSLFSSTPTPDGYSDDTADSGIYYVAYGTAKILRAMGEPRGADETEAEDIFYTRTTDGGETWLMVPWVINPDSQQGENPAAGETVYRWPWLAQGTPHQGHSQLRTHPSGTRLYAVWHQWADGDEAHLSPHDFGDDIWFRRIDFMETDEEAVSE